VKTEPSVVDPASQRGQPWMSTVLPTKSLMSHGFGANVLFWWYWSSCPSGSSMQMGFWIDWTR